MSNTATDTTTANKEAAMAYAEHGWAVLPMRDTGDDKARKSPAYLPGHHHGILDATTDLSEIAELWTAHPNCGVAIATGNMSGGIIVIDLDYHPERGIDGPGVLHEWEKEHGELPETVTAESASGGSHLYYRTTVELDSFANETLGVDLRANGGCIIAPPTHRPGVGTYAWDNHPDEYEVAEADNNVLAFIEYVHKDKLGGKDCEPGKLGGKFVLPASIGEGGRNDTLFKFASSLHAKGLPDDVIRDSVHGVNTARCNPPLKQHELASLLASALGKPKGKSRKAERKPYDLAPEEYQEIKRHLLTTQNSKPSNTIYNCLEVLTRDTNFKGKIYYDVRAYTVMVEGLPWDKPGEARPIADTDYISFTSYGERNYSMGFKNYWTDSVQATAHNHPRNLVAEWLDGLEWDGKPRMATLMADFLGAEPTEYNLAVCKLFMLGAVARAYNPGCKFDYVPVLHGKQGLGKSMFARKLAVREEWFGDGFNTFDGDHAIEKLRGIWIGEVAELLALKKTRDVEAVKSFITTQNDRIRPKYGRETEIRPRACVFIGTTNDGSFLSDSTGNRRWHPVNCGVATPKLDLFAKGAAEHIAQAWAEAVHIWKTDRPTLVLPRELETEAIAIQESYTEDDPRIGIVLEYMAGKAEGAAMTGKDRMDVRICLAELTDEDRLGVYTAQASTRKGSNELHAIIRNHAPGWELYPAKDHKARCGGYGITRCYIPTAEYWEELTS